MGLQYVIPGRWVRKCQLIGCDSQDWAVFAVELLDIMDEGPAKESPDVGQASGGP